MKIYTKVEERNNSSMVGAVLVGDNDQICFKDGFKLTIQDKVSAHMYGLKRCLSYVKNVESLEDKEVIQYLHDDVRVDIDKEMNDRIACDEYVKRFVQERGVSIMTQNLDFSKFDNEMLSLAYLEISPRTFKQKEYDY